MLPSRNAADDYRPPEVSILTRPESRMLPASPNRKSGKLKFQSSPGLKAGCYFSAVRTPSGRGLFELSHSPQAGCCDSRRHSHADPSNLFHPPPADEPAFFNTHPPPKPHATVGHRTLK